MAEQRAGKRRRKKAGAEQQLRFPLDTVMTVRELAAALRCSVRTIERMDLPTVYLGPHTKRYIWGQVLDALKERAA